MHLNLHTDYGLRVLLYLASSPSGAAPAPDIASAYNISLHHLRKVVQNLSRAGYVQTTRGRTGGLALAKPPEDIRLGQVVRDLEPDLHLAECFSTQDNACVITPACILKGALEDGRRAFLETLDRYTLAELTRNKTYLWRILGPRSVSRSAAPGPL